MDWIEPGRRVGDLEVLAEIGQGAFGRVFRARDTLIGRDVALKLVRTLSGERGERERERALAEARFMGGIQSPHLVTLYRVHALEEGGWVFEMEFVEGGSLEDLLAEGAAIEPGRALEILTGILESLRIAHRNQILHGDVKPGNVMLDGNGRVKLADFGLSRLVGDASLSASSGERMLGTPRYMAPEVIMGEKPGLAADFWSTGILAYRMLTGRFPFDDRNLNNLFVAIQNHPPAPLDPDLPPEVQRLVLRCLAKRPENRPASADELIDEIAKIVSSGALRVVEDAAQAAPRPGLFGRERERESLGALVREAREGKGLTVLVTGEAGIGKTALLEDLAHHARKEGFRWIDVAISPHSGMLRPLVEAVRGALADDGRFEERLRSGAYGAATEGLREVLTGDEAALAQSPEHTGAALIEVLARYATLQPVGLCIEDVHLACGQECGLLNEFSRLLASSRVLLALSYRTHDPDSSRRVVEGATALTELRQREAVARYDLEPLRPAAIHRLVVERARGAQVAPEVLDRVAGAAGGNPLFAIEVLRHLETSSAIVRAEDALVPGPAWDRATTPDRVRDLMLRRLDGLPADQRAILDAAAVDGVEFDGEAIAAALDRPLLEVLRHLQRLCREHGLVTPRVNGYRFTHALLRECVYRETAPDLRRATHERLARHLEARARATEPARLGLHWDRAGFADRARPYLRDAALGAARRGESMRATEFARLAGLDPARLDAADALANAEPLLALAGCWRRTGDTDAVARVYAALREAAERSGDESLALRVLVHEEAARWRNEDGAGIDATGLARAAAALAPCFEQGRAHEMLGRLARDGGRTHEATEAFRRAAEVYGALGLHGERARILDQLAAMQARTGGESDAEMLFDEAARVHRVAGRAADGTASEIARAAVGLGRGDLERPRADLERCARQAQANGAPGLAARACTLLARVRYAGGDMLRAFRAATRARGHAEQAGDTDGLAAALLEEAVLAAARGNMGQADQARRSAHLAAGSHLDADLGARAAALDAQIQCVLGRAGAAETAARHAVNLALVAGDAALFRVLAGWIAETGLYGLPVATLRLARAALPATGPEWTRAAVEGAIAALQPDAAADPLRRAAEALAGPGVGERRAALRIAAGCFDALFHERAGDPAGSAEAARAALEAARALGHVWLEACLLRVLARVEPDPQHGADFQEIIRRVAGSVDETDDRERLLGTL